MLVVKQNLQMMFQLLKTKYNIDGTEGTIAIIGPKRMEYDRVVTLLDYIKNNLGGQSGKEE